MESKLNLTRMSFGRYGDTPGICHDCGEPAVNHVGNPSLSFHLCKVHTKNYLRSFPDAIVEPLKPAADKKASNPKDLVGTRKVPILSVIPLRVLGEVALALFEGARKYGRFNWRKSGVAVSVYVDAAGRHLADFVEGVDIDKASGVHHLSKAIAGLMVLRDSIMHGNAIDDRPPAANGGTWLEAQNEQAVSIIERHPNAVPPYTEKAV